MMAVLAAEPHTVADLGIPETLVENLTLKILYEAGELTLTALCERLHLSLGVVQDIFETLRRKQLCEVTGIVAGIHRIVPTSQGRARAVEWMTISRYTGPAPVSLKDYVQRVRTQSVRDAALQSGNVRRALEHLVLDEAMVSKLGAAVASGKTAMLYGSTGTGKTVIAESLPRAFRDWVWIPYAVEVDGQIIAVYDPQVHGPCDAEPPDQHDRRWALCRRPRVKVGGELDVDMLDLRYSPSTKYYTPPIQMLANNGFLIVDDFGRQKIRPEQLLDRWIVPLDRGTDYLTLGGGRKFEIPFDVVVVFSTNLDPRKLADEAYLRRIQSKIRLEPVTTQQFHEIFRRVCVEAKLNYDPNVVDEAIRWLTELKQPLRPCYPSDIVGQIHWAAKYEGKRPEFTLASVYGACRNYFLSD